jgi:hypothetical protein
MASIWTRITGGRWEEAVIDGRDETRATASLGVSIVRAESVTNMPWVLIASPDVRVTVNGEPLLIGVRVLASRDEIRCDSQTVVFCDERAAIVQASPTMPGGVRCARCTCEIAPASPAVRCPACGSWYHQQDPGDFPCWTAIPFCQTCGQATTLGEDSWSPEEV